MPKPQPSFRAEFKHEAVQLVKTSDKPKAHIARDWGIADSAFYAWCNVAATYTSESYLKVIQEHAMLSRMSRTATGDDNAMTASCFHSFKGECVDRQVVQTRTQARRATFDDLECFYNQTRRHSTVQYLSPAMFEQVMS